MSTMFGITVPALRGKDYGKTKMPYIYENAGLASRKWPHTKDGRDCSGKPLIVEKIVEKPSDPPKKKPTTTTTDRKKSSSTAPKAKKAKTDKKSKDPNAPKRPQTAFFLFMDDFRKTYKEENPDSKGGKEVAKEGGEKWKSLDRKREKYS
ncbi:high mobility group B protein 3-like [Quercus lobata]|uniref:high mobility group B protein 3-like n=1 Tax=Quercus lobata TaxID=97700 RepID=UPI0012471FF9|nr:high mobility group B protein 3-like [Quercus lobata]XP_030943812.1 high mobility group B protein 3-like [Quercus lobata]XP_030946020.1 high mobility group B protein 3-like [Quercus lobata]XP_030949552.1 high mobility group B protein 3-like [Quercus lobata]XP_030949703.1 high mobility group B protein 3-like [Quercus lobata]XP_030964416.1 high mobility group B protein 3-like [Quercus lobata]XP_030964829.1 high mobility group B protein 3-like [Quercus lobata]XP_030970184.1 high mobility gro